MPGGPTSSISARSRTPPPLALRTGRFDRHRGDEHARDRRAADGALRPHAGAADRDRERRATRHADRGPAAGAPACRARRSRASQRSDAAGFAAALDLEDAFAAPAATGRDHRPGASREREPRRPRAAPRTAASGRPSRSPAARRRADPAAGRRARLEPRRPQRRAVDRFGAQPDRVLMWAVLLGLFLVVLATTSGPG